MNPITIQKVLCHSIALPYKQPFVTSYGKETHKVAIIVELLTSDGITGWGECSVETWPGYGSETVETALHILQKFLIPCIQNQSITNPTESPTLWKHLRGHHHTKAGLENAIWDAFAQANQLSLVGLFGHYFPKLTPIKAEIEVGVVIGIQSNPEAATKTVSRYLDADYRNFKLKIEPTHDIDIVQTLRKQFPDIGLTVDANGAYTPSDSNHLAQLDRVNLLFIEQPLAHNDFLEHSQLQHALQTPICLDEPLQSSYDVQLAYHLGIGKIISLKPARVGGFTEALKILEFAQEKQIQVKIGGMLETGIGRAGVLSLAAMPPVSLPSDISATNRYFERDITAPFNLTNYGTLLVPTGYGIGIDVDPSFLGQISLSLH